LKGWIWKGGLEGGGLFSFDSYFERKKHLPRDVCTKYAYRLACDAKGWYLP